VNVKDWTRMILANFKALNLTERHRNVSQYSRLSYPRLNLTMWGIRPEDMTWGWLFSVTISDYRMSRSYMQFHSEHVTLIINKIWVVNVLIHISKLCILPTQCIDVFRMVLTINSEFFPWTESSCYTLQRRRNVFPVRYGLYLCVPYGSHNEWRLFP
jgi:hypothetical protein